MKQLLAILFTLCIFVPETGRIIAGNICSYTIMDEDASPVCACAFNIAPADMQTTSFPDRHKEIMQQTDWQYLTWPAFNYNFSVATAAGNKRGWFNILSTASSSHRIFHPPCFS